MPPLALRFPDDRANAINLRECCESWRIEKRNRARAPTKLQINFLIGSPADGIAAAPETSARPAGGFQRNYTDLQRARKGGGGRFWPNPDEPMVPQRFRSWVTSGPAGDARETTLLTRSGHAT
jgi:hypothetical protein